MNAWLDTIAATDAGGAPEEVPAEVRERLAALGYVGIGTNVKATGNLPDPKDRIGGVETFRQALALRKEGKAQEAVTALRAVVGEDPRMVDAWYTLGVTLAGAGQTQQGIAALVKCLELEPERADAHLALAKVYAMDRDLRKAEAHAEIASTRNPGSGFELLAQLMMDANKPEQAAEYARRSIAADDARIMGHFILGNIARRAGRYEEALAHYEKAQAAKERRKLAVVRGLYHAIGDCLARLGRDAEAEAAFKREIAQLPASRDGHVALAMLYRAQGRDGEARQALASLVQAEGQPSPETYAVVVRTLRVLGDTDGARVFALQAQRLFPSDRRFR
jgi:tetratricopeptide (TPR) repeat protein